MDELMNLIIADESPSEISDSIKNQLFAKAGTRVDAVKPAVANAMLGYEIESEEDAETKGQKSEIEPEVDTSSVEAPESPEVPKGGEI